MIGNKHSKAAPSLQAFAWNTESETVASIATSENGGRCSCVCLTCGQPVEARQGAVRDWHFAHVKRTGCNANAESALHLAAKHIFEQSKRLVLPHIPKSWTDSGHGMHAQATGWLGKGELNFEKVLLESRVSELEDAPKSFTPDASGIDKDGQALFVEIRVTHQVDDEKIRKIKQHGRPCIEIDLSKCDRSISDLSELEQLVLSEQGNRIWLYEESEHKNTDISLKSSEEIDFSTGETIKKSVEANAWDSDAREYDQYHRFYRGLPVSIRVYHKLRRITVVFDYEPSLNACLKQLGGQWNGRYGTWNLPLWAMKNAMEVLR